MSAIDSYSFNASHSTDQNEYLFKDKQFIYFNDSNNGNYTSNEIKFELSALANTNRFIDWAQSFLVIPLTMSCTATTGAFTQSSENVFAMSLKNGYQHIIDSLYITYNDNPINQPSSYSNVASTWELYKMSADDRHQFADLIGFHLDDGNTIRYLGTANQIGLGECNNVIAQSSTTSGVFNPRGGWTGDKNFINNGRVKRQQNTSFDPTIVNSFLTSAQVGNQLRNFVSTNTATQITYQIFATIPMAIIHDFFQKLPILRGMNIRLNIYTNTGINLNFTTTANTYVSLSSSVIPRNTVPFQISAIGNDGTSGVGINNTAGATSVSFSLNIKNDTLSSCRFYACQYEMTPSLESLYISNPEKTILYDDFVQYSITNIPSNGQVNNMLSTGIARLRGILIWGCLSASANGGLNLNSMQSPFSSAPATTLPYAKIKNFQVQISGRPVYASPINYNFEHFIENLRPALSVNGGSLKSIGMSSGCINQSMWNSGYGFYYVDLTPTIESETQDNVSKSIQVIFTNDGALTTDYYFLVFNQKEIAINVSNGAVIAR